MTLLATITLSAVLLAAGWLLGQLPVVASRLALVFALSWLGAVALWLADSRDVSEVVQTGIAAGCAIGAIAGALFLAQPLKWGIDDYFAGLAEQMEAETTEVQP